MAFKLGSLHGFDFYVPTSGGKAGKGFQKTGTIQVRKGNMIVKQFRFTCESNESRKEAIKKAKDWAAENQNL